MKTKLTPAFVKDATASFSRANHLLGYDHGRLRLDGDSQGAKSYVVQYRAGRRSRRMTIDGVLDLSKARKRAKALLGEVAHDRDPLAEKVPKSARLTRARPTRSNRLPRTT